MEPTNVIALLSIMMNSDFSKFLIVSDQTPSLAFLHTLFHDKRYSIAHYNIDENFINV